MRRPSPEAAEDDQKRADGLQRDAQARLAASLRRLRAARAWGQEEAAWRANSAVRAYARLEAGTGNNPTLATLARVCVAFDLTDLRDLFAPAPVPPKRKPGRPRRT